MTIDTLDIFLQEGWIVDRILGKDESKEEWIASLADRYDLEDWDVMLLVDTVPATMLKRKK